MVFHQGRNISDVSEKQHIGLNFGYFTLEDNKAGFSTCQRNSLQTKTLRLGISPNILKACFSRR